MKEKFKEYFGSLKDILDNVSVKIQGGEPSSFEEAMELTANRILTTSSSGQKLMFIGNGASAAISSHMATDFWKTNGIRAIAFNDPAGLTCISNDYGYKHVFEKPIEMFADPGDMLIAISSSGQSENILKAVDAARKKGASVITLSGFEKDNPLSQMGDINFYVPSYNYGFVEVAHHAICHSWIDIITTNTLKEKKGYTMNEGKTVLVTGGAGYVGAVLVPKLLDKGYRVKVLDLYTYGEDIFDEIKDKSNLQEIKGDICDQSLLKESLIGCEAVIHLACVSNDPSFELDPELSRKVNFEAFEPLVKISKECGVKRFIYASTCSVYGISDAEQVTEDHPLLPITDYNKYKGLCEPVLFKHQSEDFTTVTIRPATVCGYSPRQRFDLSVNILTNHAYNNNHIKVFGGAQERPNIHIADITDLYVILLELPKEKIAGKIYNAGYQNRSISDIAEIVQKEIKQAFSDRAEPTIETTPSDYSLSYRISSEKIKKELDFEPKRTIEDAVQDLIKAFEAHKFENPLENIRYYNIRTLKKDSECKVS